MATWNGEPYPGFFKDQRFPESFEIDHKWKTYEDVAFEGQSKFAELNAAVLKVIHEEKRFPTKDELETIRTETLPSTWADLMTEELIYKPVGNLWGTLTMPVERNYTNEFSWDAGSGTTVDVGFRPSPATGNTTVTTYGEPVHWNGISWEDFIQDEDLKNAGYHKSALASIKGVTEKNLNHRLI